MWDELVNDFKGEELVYLEPQNEPFGYAVK
jgi:hypothetical protein